MTIIEKLHTDGVFEEYRVELTAEEKQNRVDGKTFWAQNTLDHIGRTYGRAAAIIVAIPLAVWLDLK